MEGSPPACRRLSPWTVAVAVKPLRFVERTTVGSASDTRVDLKDSSHLSASSVWTHARFSRAMQEPPARRCGLPDVGRPERTSAARRGDARRHAKGAMRYGTRSRIGGRPRNRRERAQTKPLPGGSRVRSFRCEHVAQVSIDNHGLVARKVGFGSPHIREDGGGVSHAGLVPSPRVELLDQRR